MTYRTLFALHGYMDVATGSCEGLTHLFDEYPEECMIFAGLICYLEGVVDARTYRR